MERAPSIGWNMSVAERLDSVRERVARACQRSGRAVEEVLLLGATKSASVNRIREAVDAGLDLFGENRIQEALPKIAGLRDLPLRWHFIGKLQKNKAGQAVEHFEMIQSVDSPGLAERLERVASPAEVIVPVLLEVNVGQEISKSGVLPGEVPTLCARIREFEHLRLEGLMSIPPYHPDPERVRPFFVELRRLFEDMSSSYSTVDTLSMGMSEDYEVAIEEGSTLIRLGRTLFGERI